MFYIACTRFTDETWEENINFRNKTGEQVAYASSVKIRNIYSKGCLLFVAEMNNKQNKIEGIGLIRNLISCDKHYRIHKNNEYNRFIYKGKYRLSRQQLIDINPEIVEILDNILFKGKSNLKRFLGITILTKKLFTNWNYELDDLSKYIKNAFLCVFIRPSNNLFLEDEQSDKTIEYESDLDLEI